jgi:hypothetical protein
MADSQQQTTIDELALAFSAMVTSSSPALSAEELQKEIQRLKEEGAMLRIQLAAALRQAR